MRIETIETKIYTYNELSPEAKEKVKEWLLDDYDRVELFTESCKEILKYDFPELSDIEIFYNLSYCQGDYLSIRGKFYYKEYIVKNEDKLLENGFNKKDLKRLIHLSNTISPYLYFDGVGNFRIKDPSLYDISHYREKDCNDLEKILYDFIDYIREIFETKIEELKKEGYEFFWEMEEEEIEEMCELNNYEFTIDGKIWS